MVSTAEELLSVGGLAARLGRSPSTVKFWERTGVIPASLRVSGDNRRVWRSSDVALIERQIAARNGAQRRDEADTPTSEMVHPQAAGTAA